VNADGYPDIICGARWDDSPEGDVDAGSAHVYSGQDGSVLYAFYGDEPGDGLGNFVGGVGDIDHDGRADVVAGIWKTNLVGENSGSARVYSGADGHVLFQFDGEAEGDGFGSAVHGAGDVDGDGTGDIVISAFQDDFGALTNAGSVWVYSGKDGALLFSDHGTGALDELGVEVGGGGDVDENGFADVISGAYWNDDNGMNSGVVKVWSLCDGKVLHYGQGCAGSGGATPELHLLGCPKPGSVVTLTLGSAPGGSTAFLFFGLGQGTLPLASGCALFVAPLLPPILMLPVSGSGAGQGSFSIPALLPPDVIALTFTMQVFCTDPGVPAKHCSSNGLLVGIP